MSRSETKKILKYIKTGSVKKLRHFIRKHGVDLNKIRDSENRGLLHLACYLGDERTTRYLLRQGVNPCSTDSHGNTPLHTALEYALEFNNESAFAGLVLPLKKKSKRVMQLKNNRGDTPEQSLEKLKKALRKGLSRGEQLKDDEEEWSDGAEKWRDGMKYKGDECRDIGNSRGLGGDVQDKEELMDKDEQWKDEQQSCKDNEESSKDNEESWMNNKESRMDTEKSQRKNQESLKGHEGSLKDIKESKRDKGEPCMSKQGFWKDKEEHWEAKWRKRKDEERQKSEEEREWLEKLAFESSCEDFYFKEESPLSQEEQETYCQWADRIRREYNAKRTSIQTKNHQTQPEPEEKGYEKLTQKLAKEHEEYFEKIRLKSTAARVVRERDEYEEKCKNVFEDATSGLLRFSDIPWPCSGSAVDIVEKLKEFNSEETVKYLKKQRIRWHPDRFLQRCQRRLQGRDKEQILDLVKQISQGINALIASL